MNKKPGRLGTSRMHAATAPTRAVTQLSPSTTTGRTPTIPTGLSLYLDLVRFLAAVSVVLYHTWDTLFPHFSFKWPAHEAVVIFFVLSGYVIAHATSRPGITARLYFEHRSARILPVAIAALLLSIFIAPFVSTSAFGEPVAPPIDSLAFWWATLANLSFVGQAGMLFLSPPLNTPFWSLNYEVWYYILFGIWLFAPARRRTLLLFLAACIAGPKILLLFPVWLFGVWLYKKMPALPISVAYLLFLVSIGAAAALTWLNVSDILRAKLYSAFPPAWHLHFSTQFLYDFLLGLIVAINFCAVASIGDRFRWLIVLRKPIRYLSTHTFSLYVFHMPLAILAWAVLEIQSAWSLYLFIAAGAWLLAQMTERRTAFYRRFANRSIQFFSHLLHRHRSRMNAHT